MSVKSDSWDMAVKLYYAKRISLNMARSCLKITGHTERQISKFPPPKTVNKKNRPVKCIETGIIYRSLSQAGCQFGFKSRSAIANAIQRGNAAGGYHWEFID